MKNNKMTVGILIGNICASHSDDMLNGMMHLAADYGVKTIFFMGAHANCFDELYYYDAGNKEQRYLFQFNTVFDYAKLGKMDVLIIAYSTFYLYVKESKEEFFKRFEKLDVPIIIVGDEYKNYTRVISDNHDGIRKCVEHLIEKHGYKKIAYLSGPKENNQDAEERLESYIQTMKEHGLEIGDGMIQYGDYSLNSAPLFGKILDSNPDVEAVVCANDTMALSGYMECKKRGLVPGIDIAITGFDDIPEAKSASPAMTTVEQNAYDLGYMAMKKAIDLYENGNRDSIKVPVYFKHRNSCGMEKQKKKEKCNISRENTYEEIAGKCSKAILEKSFLYKLSIEEDSEIHQILYGVIYHIEECFFSEKKKEYDVEFIDVSMHTLFGSEKISINNFLSELHKQMVNIILLQDDREREEELIHLVIHMLDYVENANELSGKYKVDNLQRNIWTTPFITRDMIENIDDTDQMYECLMERIRFMQVNNAYLFLLDEPKANEKIQDWQCPDEVSLVAKIENGIISLISGAEKLDKENGLNDIILWDNCQNMAVYVLFAGKWMYGILACEMTLENITTMYSASLHTGSALQFIELTKNQRRIQQELEQAMISLKNKNNILNMISEKDELTKLYNRRGFLENAMDMIEKAKNCYLLCIYADLDHLKEINDEFGHQEGDFAIRHAGEFLQNALKSSSVIGRIGGDEFAALAIVTDENMGKQIHDRIILSSKMFNQNSDKPYYVELSIGYVVYMWNESLELNQMLSAADSMLYESKSRRRKSAKRND